MAFPATLIALVLLLPSIASGQAPPMFDRSQLVERADSFRVMFQGNPVGGLSRSLTAGITDGANTWTYRSQLSFGSYGHQKTTVIVDRDSLRPLKVDQTGEDGGRPLEVHMVYRDGRVRGTYSVPGAGGVTVSGTADTALGPEVLDDNLLQAFAAALPLPADTPWTVHIYDAAVATWHPLQVAVSDGGAVMVPAGTFATWRLDFTGGEAAFSYFVSRTNPRRLVRIAVPSQALVFELVR